eukprot:TRINITY_DN63715_c0_g1_i1.p1 TRINITY_DN63715_c0_g1~~TRINITY_DN63715_c0_g1_i1.p1  ORF type:complete len:502 (+),score=60.90 TRINITY_DN63715_c0_g1_i1:205-1710(+)
MARRSKRFGSVLCFLFLLAAADALTHLHKGEPLEGAEFRVLRGFTHSSTKFESNADWTTHSKSLPRRTMHFEAQLKMHTMFWDELEDHGIQMTACSRLGTTHDVDVEFSGHHVDASDYVPGAAFMIDSEHWETQCDRVPPLQGIDGDDPVLFYRINNVTFSHSQRSVLLHMSAIPGSQVVPSVQTSFLKADLRRHTEKRFTFDDNPLYHTISRMLNEGDFISPGDIVQPDFENPDTFSEVVILPGSNITASGFLEGTFENFRITRLFQLEVGWTQTLKADVASRLFAKNSYYASEEREVYRRAIPDAYYSDRLLFFGRFTIRALSVVDIVQDVQIESGVDAFVRATTQNVQAVSASFSSRELDAESLLPPDFASYGAFEINFDNVIEHQVAMNGFYGARPGLLIEATLGGISLTGKFSATLGLEASLRYGNPPFAPLTQSSTSRGACDQCHALQGNAHVKGKDLQYHVHENGVLVKHKILDPTLFDTEITTVCALARACTA